MFSTAKNFQVLQNNYFKKKKCRSKKFQITRFFCSWLPLGKRHIFGVAPPGHTITRKTLIWRQSPNLLIILRLAIHFHSKFFPWNFIIRVTKPVNCVSHLPKTWIRYWFWIWYSYGNWCNDWDSPKINEKERTLQHLKWQERTCITIIYRK